MRSSRFEEALQYQQAGRLTEAIQCYRQLLQETETADLYANLGVALRTQGHLEAAIVAYRKALSITPQHVAALSNLGGGLRALGKLDEATPILQQAIALQSEFAAAHYNLGLVYMDDQQPREAIQCFDRVMALEPHRTDAPFDRATCLLQTGDLQAGFAAYECRFGYEPRLIKPYAQPKWDGSSLNGRTLLLYAEQGFGDTLQFCRYIPLIEKAGGRIIFECPRVLKRLMETVEGVDLVLCPGDTLPSFDVHASLFSLPHLFGTTLDTIPKTIPYLKVSSQKINLKTRPGSRLKVGLVWASGHQDVGVRNRSIPLTAFTALLEQSHLSFYSLQKGKAVSQLQSLGLAAFIEDMGQHIQDFADTAAVLSELDLLITADTAIVHLAGALGKPCWLLLPYGSEWRWLLQREDSPWYPSIRVFRALAREETWKTHMQRVLQALMNKLSG